MVQLKLLQNVQGSTYGISKSTCLMTVVSSSQHLEKSVIVQTHEAEIHKRNYNLRHAPGWYSLMRILLTHLSPDVISEGPVDGSED